MSKYNQPRELKTKFGRVKIVYQKERNTPEHESLFSSNIFDPLKKTVKKGQTGYYSEIVDGNYRGWNSWGISRHTSVTNLMVKIVTEGYSVEIGNLLDWS
jgi:hypothetical protein